MQCPRCRHDNPSQAKFCLECGTHLALACRKCGSDLPAGAKFCLECGESVGNQTATQSRLGSPAAYTPKHLVEKILAAKTSLEGERKQVTVLFADIKGSTELIAERDPEEADKLLNPVLEYMMEAVHRYEGTVTRVMGDGIMALFGAPVAHEDHALRACYAALAMQETIHRFGEQLRREQGFAVQIRVGLNSGEVVVRSIGNDLYMEYTAVGQTAHLAARMEQLAEPGTTLLTGDTLRLAEGYVEVKGLGLVPVKGLAEPIEVYTLIGAGLARRRFEAAAIRGLTRFVGRDAELEHLRRALERASKSHGQMVAVVGEPGVGKSRLFFEFTHSHRTHGWLILQSSSVSYGKATSYLPLVDLLKAYFQIEARDDPRKIREKVSGKLVTLDESLMRNLSAFLALLDVPVEDPHWHGLDSRQRREQTLDACKRLLLREGQVQPVVLVFEDLHWIDSATQAFLGSFIESLPTARILLLLSYRPEYQHAWGSRTYYTQLRIDPLLPENAEELLNALLGSDLALRTLKRLLIERTEGNPLFLEESVRTLVETQALTGERGAYRLVHDVTSIKVAPTVQAVLAARIDRLPPEEKGLLQVAAVVGETVPFNLLEAVTGLSEESLRRGLAHLQAAEFLYEVSLFPGLEYTFKHGLTCQVAYSSLLQEQRKILHARIVEALEHLYPDRLTEHVERLAYHAFRGEVWDKAVSYLRQAAIKAATRSAHREAVPLFEQTLLATTHLPADRHTLEQAIDLRFELRNSFYVLGEFDRMIDCLRQAEALAIDLGDQRRLGQITAYLTNYFFWTGKPKEAAEFGQRSLAIAAALDDFTLTVRTNLALGQTYYFLGDYGQSVELIRKTLRTLEGQDIRERYGLVVPPVVTLRNFLILCLSELGEFREATSIRQELTGIAQTLDQLPTAAIAYYNAGLINLQMGALDEAIPKLERGLEICRTANPPLVWFPTTASGLGTAYALSGRLDEALPLLQAAVDQAAATKRMVDYPLFVARLSEGYLLAGRADQARPLAERALALAREYCARGNEAWIVHILGEVTSRAEPRNAERARNHYEQAMNLAGELGMRPLIARCHLGLGRLYAQTGEHEQAFQHLDRAATLFREMDMHFWLAQAEAESKS